MGISHSFLHGREARRSKPFSKLISRSSAKGRIVPQRGTTNSVIFVQPEWVRYFSSSLVPVGAGV
jgi:hypothetical protein